MYEQSKMIIAGTGHRPKYCPCKYNDSHDWLINLKKRLANYLIEIQDPDGTIIRTGMAIGLDTWLAEVVIELQDQGIGNFDLHAYVPFKGQGDRWPQKSREKHAEILDNCSKVFYTADNYYPKVFLDRDIAMITGADIIVSLLNPEVKSGGTYFTVQEAKKRGISNIVNFWND